MELKFEDMKTAVEKIRNEVQTLLKDHKTFTPGDPSAEQYQKCCDVRGLREDPRFPNVSH